MHGVSTLLCSDPFLPSRQRCSTPAYVSEIMTCSDRSREAEQINELKHEGESSEMNSLCSALIVTHTKSIRRRAAMPMESIGSLEQRDRESRALRVSSVASCDIFAVFRRLVRRPQTCVFASHLLGRDSFQLNFSVLAPKCTGSRHLVGERAHLASICSHHRAERRRNGDRVPSEANEIKVKRSH